MFVPRKTEMGLLVYCIVLNINIKATETEHTAVMWDDWNNVQDQQSLAKVFRPSFVLCNIFISQYYNHNMLYYHY